MLGPASLSYLKLSDIIPIMCKLGIVSFNWKVINYSQEVPKLTPGHDIAAGPPSTCSARTCSCNLTAKRENIGFRNSPFE